VIGGLRGNPRSFRKRILSKAAREEALAENVLCCYRMFGLRSSSWATQSVR
jgi:hypothetical protein